MPKMENKLKKQMDMKSLASFFKEIACEMEGVNQTGGSEIAGFFDKMTKLELKLKSIGAEYHLKLKVSRKADAPHASSENPAAGPSEIKKETYKEIKKRMKTAFETIGEALADQRLPDKELFETFMADSMKMITYANRGDEMYKDYEQACQALADAYHATDFKAFEDRYHHLAALKKACHAKHK